MGIDDKKRRERAHTCRVILDFFFFFVTDSFFEMRDEFVKKRDERTFSFPNFNYRDECNDDENLWSSSEILSRGIQMVIEGDGERWNVYESKSLCGDRRMTVQGAITWFVAVIRARGTADKRAAWFAANGINLGSRGTYVRVVRATHWACRTQRLARG